MMMDMTAMQKDVGKMMSDIEVVMRDERDPTLTAKMQAVHEQMAALMGNVMKMPGAKGMMGNKGRGPNASKPEPTAVPSAPSRAPEGHDAHHPK